LGVHCTSHLSPTANPLLGGLKAQQTLRFVCNNWRVSSGSETYDCVAIHFDKSLTLRFITPAFVVIKLICALRWRAGSLSAPLCSFSLFLLCFPLSSLSLSVLAMANIKETNTDISSIIRVSLLKSMLYLKLQGKFRPSVIVVRTYLMTSQALRLRLMTFDMSPTSLPNTKRLLT
jgi:hypothetical protein